jgi:hypothetical protein
MPDLTHARGDFVGIDGVYYATEEWGLADTPDRLPAMIVDRCGTVANFPEIERCERTQARAANATYVHVLLSRLFARTGRRLVKAVPTRRDGDTILTWTRGYLIARFSRP